MKITFTDNFRKGSDGTSPVVWLQVLGRRGKGVLARGEEARVIPFDESALEKVPGGDTPDIRTMLFDQARNAGIPHTTPPNGADRVWRP